MSIPVIAIDGPSASGKGTIAAIVAQRLGFHYLDSGAIYRVTAYAALQNKIDLADEPALVELAGRLDLRFDGAEVYLDGRPVGDAIRTEEAGRAASTIAVLPRLREALLARQRAFRQAPGLATDGRDMGTVVFPDAQVKVFLTASAEERANRRYKQLIEKGFCANFAQILQDLQERDARDAARSAAPLQHAPDAVLIDTTGMTIEAVVQAVLDLYSQAPA
ncbi:cytidylate kinase [Sulfuritortus calidifontis]|uniref:Cytidylate kinase n=1 Tax=Sulfuritortus calidifontis TaxID=1914471 RepID=A0A4R3JTP7_9PROT|nr:(d)CMP kinase [Sulfuritortus calidifontis]TCS70875.1 cytidylate kinase [Sulfuritortus calidifontis]